MMGAFFSGDGGIRTRVRKIRPLNVYKLSQPISGFAAAAPAGWVIAAAIRWPPKGPLNHPYRH